MSILEELKINSKKFNKVIIWGLKSQWHTHRFIFQYYYTTLKKAGVHVVWVNDEEKSKNHVEPKDLIISASGMHGKMVPEKKSLEDYHLPIRDDIYYCLHAENDFFLEKINKEQYIHLKYYSNEAEQFEKISEAVHWDSSNRTLYQPWGTDLLPEEFKKPTFNRHKFMFWVGSIWSDKNGGGNIQAITTLKQVLNKLNLKFIHIRFVPDFLNAILIRISRITPAIGGSLQVEINYLPDRMFKNISYGQLGFSNIKKFNDIFKGCNIYEESMKTQVEKVLALSKDEYLSIVKKQQEICKNFTISHNINNFFKLF